MIVGNGLLATAFAPRFASDRALTVFASGVANSRETRQAEFEREREAGIWPEEGDGGKAE